MRAQGTRISASTVNGGRHRNKAFQNFSALKGADKRQVRINQTINRICARLELGARVEHRAKTASLIERRATVGQAQRLAPCAVAVAAVAVACDLLRIPRELSMLARPVGVLVQRAARAKKLLQQNGEARRVLPGVHPAKGPVKASFQQDEHSAGLAGCRVILNQVLSHEQLQCPRPVMVATKELLGRVWANGCLEGRMPRTVAASVLVVAARSTHLEGWSSWSLKRLAEAFGITTGTIAKAVKKIIANNIAPTVNVATAPRPHPHAAVSSAGGVKKEALPTQRQTWLQASIKVEDRDRTGHTQPRLTPRQLLQMQKAPPVAPFMFKQEHPSGLAFTASTDMFAPVEPRHVPAASCSTLSTPTTPTIQSGGMSASEFDSMMGDFI